MVGGWLWGARLFWRYPTLCKLQQVASGCFVWSGRNFFFLKIEEIKKTKSLFQISIFNLRQENKSWWVILGTSVFLHHVFRDMLIYFSTRLVFFRDWEFSRWIQAFFFQNLYTIRFSQVFQFECTHFFGNMTYHSDERAFHNSLVASHHPWCRAARFHQFVFLTHLRLKPWRCSRLCWCPICKEAVAFGKLFFTLTMNFVLRKPRCFHSLMNQPRW